MDLHQLVGELVSVLLPLGVTPKAFSKIAREGYIRAAASKSRLRNGKVNHSKVAALTGLPRAEIKRILSRPTHGFEPDHRARTPSERVVDGWLTDRRFRTRDGHPKSLVVDGKPLSFQRLVKEYGGDISPRAVLEELMRSKVVRRIEDRLALKVSRLPRGKRTLGTLARLIPTLVDSLRIAAREPASAIDSSLYRLTLQAATETDLVLVRERCLTSVRSLLYGLKESLERQPTLPLSNRIPRHLLTVTVLLAETDANS
jgi:hypothetical protein